MKAQLVLLSLVCLSGKSCFCYALDASAIPFDKLNCPSKSSTYKCPFGPDGQKYREARGQNSVCMAAARQLCMPYINACGGVRTVTGDFCQDSQRPEHECLACPGKKTEEISCTCEDKEEQLRFEGVPVPILVQYTECRISQLDVSCTTNFCLERLAVGVRGASDSQCPSNG